MFHRFYHIIKWFCHIWFVLPGVFVFIVVLTLLKLFFSGMSAESRKINCDGANLMEYRFSYNFTIFRISKTAMNNTYHIFKFLWIFKIPSLNQNLKLWKLKKKQSMYKYNWVWIKGIRLSTSEKVGKDFIF